VLCKQTDLNRIPTTLSAFR